ncbi:hypothetical protein OH77DRAFT_1415658, partial [Trametes cingulata]
DKRRLARHYVAHAPLTLWHWIGTCRAVVGGAAALCFILRQQSDLPHTLDIYVSSAETEKLLCALEDDTNLQLLRLTPRTPSRQTASNPNTPTSRTARTTLFSCLGGRSIAVHTSVSLSTIDPIVSTWTTALINYVGQDTIACGYPSLTFNRRALAAPLAPYSTQRRSIAHYLKASLHFVSNANAAAWPDYGVPPNTDHYLPCFRHWYACPLQSRFFGDPGSLLTFLDPLNTNEVMLRRGREPPYGMSTVWRMGAHSSTCDGPCLMYDSVLPRHETSCSILVPHITSCKRENYVQLP